MPFLFIFMLDEMAKAGYTLIIIQNEREKEMKQEQVKAAEGFFKTMRERFEVKEERVSSIKGSNDVGAYVIIEGGSRIQTLIDDQGGFFTLDFTAPEFTIIEGLEKVIEFWVKYYKLL